MINNTWNSNFTSPLRQLCASIWVLNQTRAQVEVWSPFSVIGRWISSTWSSVKEWVAIGFLFIAVVPGLTFLVRWVRVLALHQQRTNMIIRHAILATVLADPHKEVWLSMLEQ